MVDMMPGDMPHTDDKAKRKIHQGAKICLIISLVLVALLVCGFVLLPLYYSTELTYDMGDPYPFTKYDKPMDVSSLISLCTQPFGILLGIYALVQIKKKMALTAVRAMRLWG